MDGDQAAEIFEHLFGAARELDEARAVASAFAAQDESAASLEAARIGALADSGRFEGAGDLRKWRHSGVPLKD